MSRLFQAKVIENTHLSSTHNLIKISPEGNIPQPSPGQFYLLKPSDTLSPFLMRPFSILRWSKRSLEFLVMMKGKGTKLLRAIRPGELIDVIGPLGNGFPIPSDDKSPLIIAGGVGVAAVFPLIGIRRKGAYLFYGASTASELCLLSEIKTLTGNLCVSTDDGTAGFHGSIVSCFADFLESVILENPVVYGCGPSEMLTALTKLLREKNLSGYIALEERMACGIGSCLGCVVNTKKGYQRVCKEGPVFRIEEFL